MLLPMQPGFGVSVNVEKTGFWFTARAVVVTVVDPQALVAVNV